MALVRHREYVTTLDVVSILVASRSSLLFTC